MSKVQKYKSRRKNKKVFKIKVLVGVFILIIAFLLIIHNIKVNKILNMSKNERISYELESMSIEEKINQMIFLALRYGIDDGSISGLTELKGKDKKFLKTYKPGGVILFSENINNKEQLEKLVDDINKCYKDIGVFIGIDEEGGDTSNINIYEKIPSAKEVGRSGDSENAYRIASLIANNLNEVGINVNFAPVCDIEINKDVIGSRSFGGEVDTVIEFSTKFINGLSDNNIIGCAKHFPGYGAVSGDSHLLLPTLEVSKEIIYNRELKPFINSIESGIEMIMVGHMNVTALDNGIISSLSNKIVTDLLKEELKFEGIVITDSLEMKAITDKYSTSEAVKMAINAGCDMILMPLTVVPQINSSIYDELIKDILTYIDDGEIDMERIDDSVRRILNIKWDNGVL